MRPVVSATALLAVLLLSACSTTAPGSAPTEAEIPATVGEAAIDTIVLASNLVLLVGGGEAVEALDVADAPAVAAALTDLLGQPEEETFEARDCASASTVLRWGDALQLVDAEADPYGDLQVTAFAASITTPDGDSIAIESPGGIGVGDDIGAYIAALDPELTEGFDQSARVVVDRGWPSEDHPVGTVVLVEEGTVMNLSTPDSVNSPRGC